MGSGNGGAATVFSAMNDDEEEDEEEEEEANEEKGQGHAALEKASHTTASKSDKAVIGNVGKGKGKGKSNGKGKSSAATMNNKNNDNDDDDDDEMAAVERAIRENQVTRLHYHHTVSTHTFNIPFITISIHPINNPQPSQHYIITNPLYHHILSPHPITGSCAS